MGALRAGAAILRQDPYHLSLWSRIDPERIIPKTITKLNDDDITKLRLPLPHNFNITGIGPRDHSKQQVLAFSWRLESEVDGQLVLGSFAEPVTTIRATVPPSAPT
jgi:hypothetical protein